jgi:hypothetical protein
MRAVIYACYSSEKQREASIDDQIRLPCAAAARGLGFDTGLSRHRCQRRDGAPSRLSGAPAGRP